MFVYMSGGVCTYVQPFVFSQKEISFYDTVNTNLVTVTLAENHRVRVSLGKCVCVCVLYDWGQNLDLFSVSEDGASTSPDWLVRSQDPNNSTAKNNSTISTEYI